MKTNLSKKKLRIESCVGTLLKVLELDCGEELEIIYYDEEKKQTKILRCIAWY